MKDYKVKISVSNDRILTAINNAGYKSVMEFAQCNDITYPTLLNLIAMKITPLKNNGDLTLVANKLCTSLKKMPCELFNDTQMYEGLDKNTYEFSLDEKEVGVLISSHENKQKSYLEFYDDLDEVLSTLTPTEADVIKKRFGIETEEMTLFEVGNYYGLTRERVRQIEAKALRKMRHPTRCDVLKPYLLELA